MNSSFLNFCKICEELLKENSKLKKIEILSSYLRELKEDDLITVCRFLSGNIFEKGSKLKLNLGYSTIMRVLLDVTGKEEEDLKPLYVKYGDLGKTAEELLNYKAVNSFFTKPLNLQDVFFYLQKIAKAKGPGSTEEKKKFFQGLIINLSPLEGKYLIKLVTNELRIGVMEGMVEEALARAFSLPFKEIHSALLTQGDLGYVAFLAKEGKLHEVKVKPFHPLSFMLADTMQTAEEIWEYYKKPLLAEYKYDGVRIQIHKYKDEVRIYSRRLEDITQSFVEILSSIKRIDSNFIVDGEVLAFRDSPLPFYKLQQRLRRKEVSEELIREIPLRLFVYDILWIDDKSLIDLPLIKRREIMKDLEKKGMSLSHSFLVNSAEEIIKIFERSKEEGYEGLVVKNLESKYLPGKRGKNWIKLKKEMDTLDVVIVAAEYGHGKRAGLLSDYTFAVRDKEEFRVIGKAYSGLTDNEIEMMTQKLLSLTIKDEGFRKLVKPEIVIEVAFDSIQRSHRHGEGFALRFPRIKRIRFDKSVEDIDTIEKVEELYSYQS
ncbi:MAG: ATP-dependent DNA ligase [Nitrososphaerales archaeon]